MSQSPPARRRLSLTKGQLAEEAGAQLLELLCEIVADGRLLPDEVDRLRGWLAQNRNQEIPAITHLAECLDRVLADGVLSESELIEIQLAIEKVLPVTERAAAAEARKDAESAAGPEAARITKEDLREMVDTEEPKPRWEQRSHWRNHPMTAAQRAFIKSLGGAAPAGATKGQASDLIDQLLGNRPITSRQQMVMRFWGRHREVGEGPREIAVWLDEWHAADPDHKRAWELFKCEAEDDGLQGIPERVPLGVGPDYLKRIKAGGADAVPRFRGSRRSGEGPRRLRWLVGGAAATIMVLIIMGARDSEQASESNSPSVNVGAGDRSSDGARSIPEPTFVEPTVKEKVPATPVIEPAPAKTFVSRLALTGIIGGTEPRVVIQGQLYRIGQLVDQNMNIRVIGIDQSRRRVLFEDGQGNRLERFLD